MTYYGRFKPVRITDFQPEGHLKTFLETQRDGLGGNYAVMGYPFNTPMWDGGVGKVEFKSNTYRSPSYEIPADETWWPYEQSAYLLDGLLRLGYLLREERFVDLFRQNMEYVLSHPTEEGILGWCYNKNRSQWPMIVLTRALIAYYRVSGDERIKEALHRHYLALSDKELYNDMRHINMLEGMLTVYDWTGDSRLLDRAVQAYAAHDAYCAEKVFEEESELRWSKLTSGKNFTMHGVSFSESVKLPVMLYMYTGNREYLDKAEAGLEDVLRRHEQIPGIISSDEYLSGKDPLQGYESCVLTDFTWALGYFLMATGKSRYADRIEKIIYNALPGAITKDFSALQYFSAPNQVTAGPETGNTHFFYMRSSLRQYRINHFPQCCSGNIQKAMPNFVSRMFMKKENNSPAAVLYGPVVFRDSFAGCDYEICEKTDYPYSDAICFEFHTAEDLAMPFSFRIPEWCKAPRISLNGKPVHGSRDGDFITLERTWKNGDRVELVLPMEVRQIADRQWSHFEYGPLVFSYPVPSIQSRDDDTGRFSSLIIEPAGKWNYGILPGTAGTIRKIHDASNPLQFPPLVLDVTAVEVDNYGHLQDERFTPPVPLFCNQTSEPQPLTLVPMGSTTLRITAFPDVQPRRSIPLFDVLYMPRYFPYDVRKPLPEQHFLPERLTDEAFRKASREAQMQPGLYCDLQKNIGPYKEVLGYVKFYFYARQSGRTTFAVSASDAAVGYYQGKQFCEIQGVSEGEFMEPQWFQLDTEAGWIELLFKVAESNSPFQYYNSWGIRVKAFQEDRQ